MSDREQREQQDATVDFNSDAEGIGEDLGIVGSPANAPGDVGINRRDMAGQPSAAQGTGDAGDMNAHGAGTDDHYGLGTPQAGVADQLGGAGTGMRQGGASEPGASGIGESITDVDKGVGDNPVSVGGDVGNTGQTGGLRPPTV